MKVITRFFQTNIINPVIRKIIMGLFMLTGLFVNAQTPVAYYPFNGDANDAVGTNHGTVHGATLTADRFGNANSAYNFNGSSNRIEIPDNAVFQSTNLSISAWFNIAGSNGQQVQVLISKALGSGPNNSFVPAYNFTYSQMGVYLCNYASCETVFSPLANNTGWFHYAFTFDDATNLLKHYINGTLANTVITPHVMIYDNSPVTIGCEYNENILTSFTNGKIDDVKFFNTALTAEEVLAEYGSATGQNYRSITSGDWSSPSSWEVFNGTSFEPATNAPSSADGEILIRSGHAVSINSVIAIDQVIVEEGGTINQNTDVYLDNGTGTDLSIRGNYNWNAGLMNIPGNTVIETGGLLSIYNNINHGLRASITNYGTINWQDGNLKLSNSPVIINNGIFNISGNNSISPDYSGGNMINNGSIIKSSAGSTGFSGFDIINNGSFSSAGTIDMQSMFTSTGSLNLNDATFQTGNGGVYVHDAGAEITGTGALNNFVAVVLNSDLNLPAGIIFNNYSDFNIASGVVLTINGTINWFAANGGGAGSSMILPAGANLNFIGGSIKKVNVSIDNSGTINWQDGALRFSANPVITNNGSFIISGNNVTAPEYSAGSIVNNGTLSKISNGTTIFSGIGTFTNSITGIINGVGTVNLFADIYNNSGIIAPGNSPGILTFDNQQPLTDNSTLEIEISDGLPAGTGYDQLVRNGDLTLAGTLTVSETGVVPNGTYTIINLTSGAIGGNFSTLSLPAGYSVQVNASNVQLIKSDASIRNLNLTVFLESLYNGGSQMRKAQNPVGDEFNGVVADQVVVELHNSTNYSNIEFTSGILNLSTSGTIATAVPTVLSGTYYVTIRHRNSLETTTATPVSFAGGAVSHNFDSPAKAYGGNLQLMADGQYAIYAGDVNLDGSVDTGDMTPVDNDAADYAAGYLPTDANGDGIVDTADITIVDNNGAAYVTVSTP